MKYIIKLSLLIVSFFIIPSTFASQIDFFGENNYSWGISLEKNVSDINNSLSEFYKKTGLNTDVVILGKGDKCYLEANFDTCVQEEHNYSSDLIIVLSMTSDIKSKGDIRSLIKDDYKEVLQPSSFKNMQDKIIPFFINSDFTGGVNRYLELIQESINSKCLEVGFEQSCDVNKLSKEHHSYVAEKEYKKKYNAMMKIIYYVIFFILVILTYKLLKEYYIKRISNLYKDTKYKLTISKDYKIFTKDREQIVSELEILKDSIKNKLGDLDKNTFHIRNAYKLFKKQFVEIENKLSLMQKSFSEKEELKEKVENMKNINL